MPLRSDNANQFDQIYSLANVDGLNTHQLRRRMIQTMVPYLSLQEASPPPSPNTLDRRHFNPFAANGTENVDNGFVLDSNLCHKPDQNAAYSNISLEQSSDNEKDDLKLIDIQNTETVQKPFSPRSYKQMDDTDEVKRSKSMEVTNDDSSFYSSSENAPLLTSVDEYEMSALSIVDQAKRSSEPGQLQPSSHSADSEGACTIALQVFIPFLIAGCGTVGAGLVLDVVQHWRVFTEVPQIFILVPALLGLKGNLEMTLASRLSTLANLGRMDTKSERISQIVGNLALIQAQAAVVAFLAAVFAIVLGWVPKGNFEWGNAFLLCAGGLATASLASFVLGCVMVFVVILSRYCKINPDNVATPIAASLGDLTTLSLLAAIGTILINAKDHQFWLAPLVISFFILLCPLWIWISARNPVTRQVLISGWSPVIFSMLISSAGGFILEFTVARFKGIAVFQPVINGIGGNLVAVQASRLSTCLHKTSRLGVLPPGSPKTCYNPCETFCTNQVNSVATRVLLAIVVPGHLIFMYMIHFLRAGHTPITPLFAFIYLSAAVVQVAVLLFVCQWMVHSMWKRKIDPDNSAIPYLTALGDLLGTGLLAVAFHVLHQIGGKEADVGE